VKEIGFQMPEIPDKFKPHGIEPARSALNFKYAIKYNLKIGELEKDGFGKIAEQIKGNIGERMFNKTSLEWKPTCRRLTCKQCSNPSRQDRKKLPDQVYIVGSFLYNDRWFHRNMEDSSHEETFIGVYPARRAPGRHQFSRACSVLCQRHQLAESPYRAERFRWSDRLLPDRLCCHVV
jgi:hypothetical protein